MVRLEGWEDRLDAAIEEARRRPFEWGVHDCALFAAGIVEALTGFDCCAEWRGGYAGEAEAAQVVRASGGLSAMVTAVLGQPILIAFAQRGDVVMIEVGPSAEWEGALGVCVGDKAAVATASGLRFAPRAMWLHAWRVGAGA